MDDGGMEYEVLNTPEKGRCHNCCALVSGDNGEWLCDEAGCDIHKIGNIECPEGLELED